MINCSYVEAEVTLLSKQNHKHGNHGIASVSQVVDRSIIVDSSLSEVFELSDIVLVTFVDCLKSFLLCFKEFNLPF